MTVEPKPNPFTRRMRTVEPAALASLLATALELPEARALIAQRVAWFPKDPPGSVAFVDADLLLAWTMTGIRISAMILPTYGKVMALAGRSLLLIAMARSDGSISEVARAVDSSRKVVRERLRRFRIYDGPDIASTLLDETPRPKVSSFRSLAGSTVAALTYLMRHADVDDQPALGRAIEAVARLGRSVTT